MNWFLRRRWLATAVLASTAKWTAMQPWGVTIGDWFIGAMRFKRHDWSKGKP